MCCLGDINHHVGIPCSEDVFTGELKLQSAATTTTKTNPKERKQKHSTGFLAPRRYLQLLCSSPHVAWGRGPVGWRMQGPSAALRPPRTLAPDLPTASLPATINAQAGSAAQRPRGLGRPHLRETSAGWKWSKTLREAATRLHFWAKPLRTREQSGVYKSVCYNL